MTSTRGNHRSFDSATIILLAVITLIYAAMTVHRNASWKDEFVLWTDVISKSPNKSRGYGFLGLTYAMHKQYQEAFANFYKALSLNPDNVEARYNLGVLYRETGRYDEAITELRKAIFTNPDLNEPYPALLEAYMLAGRYEDAIVFLKSLGKLRSGPGRDWTYVRLGEAYARLGDTVNAELYLKQAFVNNPSDPTMLNSLGNLYLMTKRPADAVQYYLRALEFDSGNPEPVYNAAIAFDQLGDAKKAAFYYRKFIALNPRGYKDTVDSARVRLKSIENP